MAYFVTGATGFIGRRLVERLLEKRQGKVYVLVRETSLERLDDLIERWSVVAGRRGGASACSRSIGDLRRPLLGVEQEQVTELRGKIDHFFHLAAVYDMTAPAERNTAVNVGGTTHAVELARALDVERLHHVSSIAVAGEYKGAVRRGHVRRGPEAALAVPPHQVRVRADRARAALRAVARVPAGDRRRRLADRRDGQDRRARTTSSRRSSARASCCPSGCRWSGLDLGNTNVVPVDWVAGALDHIAHEPDLDGQRLPPDRPAAASASTSCSTSSPPPRTRRASRSASTNG